MLDEQAAQCGYCYNGMIVKAAELLSKNPRPDEAQIRNGDERPSVPLRDVSEHHPGRASCIGDDGGDVDNACNIDRGGAAMSARPRREFLKTGGALVIGFGLRDVLAAQATPAVARGAVAGPPDARQIDTWLAIHADNTATVYIGFAELGQGTSTALLQIAADELDLEMGQIKSVRLDTNVTPNQGGTYSSASIARGGPQVRQAAAEAQARASRHGVEAAERACREPHACRKASCRRPTARNA